MPNITICNKKTWVYFSCTKIKVVNLESVVQKLKSVVQKLDSVVQKVNINNNNLIVIT